MVQKPKKTESEMPGPKKVEPAKRFSDREIVETINANDYTVRLIRCDTENTATVAVLKDGRSIGRYEIMECESGVIDDVLVVTNIGGPRFNGIGLGKPLLQIGYLVPAD